MGQNVGRNKMQIYAKTILGQIKFIFQQKFNILGNTHMTYRY
jgi:hypothetical protein